jgi:glycosyltransferase involved in cell wall biosynthesis
MNDKPIVGLYMPAHNVAQYIGEAIKSIVAQDFEDWELVVLDDASEDGTFDAAMKEANDHCCVVRNDSRCGLIGRLKNEAIGHLCESEFICHIGSDDIIPPDCLSSFVSFMRANPNLVAACSTFDCFDDAGNKWMMPHVQNLKGFDSSILLKFMNFFPMRFYKTEAIKAVGGYSDSLSSAVDYDLALRLDEKFPGQLGRLEGKITYHYRQHPTQVSRAARPEQDLNAKRALQAALDRRGTGQEVANDRPPFQLRGQEHFIWGKR